MDALWSMHLAANLQNHTPAYVPAHGESVRVQEASLLESRIALSKSWNSVWILDCWFVELSSQSIEFLEA
jgi:hypothetical protein